MKAKTATEPKAPRKSRKRIPIARRKLAGVSISIQRRRLGSQVARVVVHSGDKRITRGFETIEQAKAFAQSQEIEAMNAGARAASEIGDNERRVLLHAKEQLAPHGKTLADAVAFYLAHLRATDRSATVAAVIKSLTDHKQTEELADRYLGDLKSKLDRFSRDFGKRPMAGITSEEISQWLTGLNLEPVGTNNYRRVLAVLFNFAAARGYCAEGIMKRTVRMKVVEKDPGILTVGECTALLHTAAPEVRAGLAIALFTGIRDAELFRLDWRAVDLESESLIVGAGVSKLSARRVIPIRENLKAWLEPLRQLGGKVLPARAAARPLVEQARRAAGFGTATEEETAAGVELRPWPHNALRHSYASYRLQKWPDAAALALELGNSPAVILKHYRATVKPAAAEAFWKITPDAAVRRNVVEMDKVETASRTA